MPDSQPPAGQSGGGRAHLQPLGPLEAVPDSFVEDLPVDERLDRMLGDEDLLWRLQLGGFASEQWNPVAEEFARYGVDVITGWVVTGAIFGKVHAKTGYALRRPEERFDRDAITTLADDTVIAALDAFLEKVLKRGRWDPSGGASLKTFFIGQCCFQFPNAYKRWWRAEASQTQAWLDGDLSVRDERLRGMAPGADTLVLLRAEAVEALGLLSTDTAREVVRRASLGVHYDEIAAELGLADAVAVQNIVDYQRRRLRRRRSA